MTSQEFIALIVEKVKFMAATDRNKKQLLWSKIVGPYGTILYSRGHLAMSQDVLVFHKLVGIAIGI